MLALVLLATIVGISVNLLRADGIPLRPPDVYVPGLEFLEDVMISLDDAKTALSSGDTLFIDARPEEAFEEGHIPGAMNLPWLHVIQSPDIVSKVPDNALIIIYDDQDSASALLLATFLTTFGHRNVRVLEHDHAKLME
jgi:3-mercaptopyruvate sulfurtransferase SseA